MVIQKYVINDGIGGKGQRTDMYLPRQRGFGEERSVLYRYIMDGIMTNR